ncbi:MAG: hypothetical protein V1747_02765 [Candidatus Omnitrophota bacterium]
MRMITNRKGTILVATYMVLCVIIVVASSFFSMVLTDNKTVARDNDGARALSNAERGIAYAYFEANKMGWDWYTHEWNGSKKKLIPIPPAQRVLTRADLSFNSDKFVEHNSGSFMLKAYPDATRENDTVVVSMGICGKERRVLMYYLTRRGIYDFFIYTPYDLDLYDAVGHHPLLNGGGIHSNGDIHIDSYMRLEDISELSAGASGNIYYEGSQYIPPYYADRLDSVMDGKSPITRLDKMADVFRDDTINQAGPFGYYNAYGQWQWDSGATYFVYTDNGLRNSFQSTEGHFAGSVLDIYNVNPGQTSGGAKNDSGGILNSQNAWIKPYMLDSEGNQIDKTWVEIPAEMDTEWGWDKYGWNNYGTVAGEQPVSFYTYKDDGTQVDVANTYWEINASNKVEMLDPPIGGTPEEWAVFNAAHPEAKQYWDMYATPEFWKANYNNAYYEYLADMINPEMLDGTYGDERLNSDILMVKHTNSEKQPDDWKAFLSSSGLDGIVRDGNTGGEYLEPPDFDTTYSRLAERDGLYIDLDSSFDGNFDDYDEWQEVLEKSIDNAVNSLNQGTATHDVAKKVKFINTFTGEWNVVLEIDFKNMQTQSRYPSNGILYTKVPIRITNAAELARAKPKYGFTILGEENIYLQGDYNTDQWVTSAVISKKRIFTLSDDFNDPQVKPALEHYPDYPYLYVKDDGSGNYAEVPKTTSGGQWVIIDYLDDDGFVDKLDYYAGINDTNEASLRSIILAKENDYRSVFNKPDPSGSVEDTWTWSGTGESYTSGMMPNTVSQDHTYNALMSTNRWLDTYQSNKGDILENWSYLVGASTVNKRRNLNGAFFVLENSNVGGFTAANNEFVDYRNESGLGYDQRGRSAGTGDNFSYNRGSFLRTYDAQEAMSYDEQFKTATRAPSDVFFGGAESLWSETTEAFFYQLNF